MLLRVGNQTAANPEVRKTSWRFSDLLEDPLVKQRWEHVRKYFFLRESTYDMTSRCNLRCDGCYYYQGQKHLCQDQDDVEKWRQLMREEKARGITYVVLAGAEPALVSDLCQVCYDEMPLGAIATNGLKPIPKSVGYRIHVSVWGNDETSLRTRNAPNMLRRQIENYQGDERAVFVYTFTPHNIDDSYAVTQILAQNGIHLTYNVFSSPVGYHGDLKHTEASLVHVRKAMLDHLNAYPDTVLFSAYNAIAHTHKFGLHDLFCCSYPRQNSSTDVGLGRSFRQYRTDLTWNREAACCVPDTDCADCRHYAAGSAIVTARLYRHATRPDSFRAWLDYVDTYLAVWVFGYKKAANLQEHAVAPPGHELFSLIR
jgi:MoaA/NifB/PqqE/SkfB family radical SAM enzyme